MEKQFLDMFDYMLEEFEGNLSQLHRKKEIKHGAGTDSADIINALKKDVTRNSYILYL